jgi:hypothetical protein
MPIRPRRFGSESINKREEWRKTFLALTLPNRQLPPSADLNGVSLPFKLFSFFGTAMHRFNTTRSDEATLLARLISNSEVRVRLDNELASGGCGGCLH